MVFRSFFSGHPHRQTLLQALPVLLAFVLALICAQVFTHGQVLFEEEAVHLFQANTLRTGQLRHAYPVLGAWLSESGLILQRESGWFAPTPVGHALWLLPGVLISFPHLMSALAAALNVFLMTLIGKRLRFPTFLLPIMLLVSPFFLFLHGTLLPQTLGMLLGTLFLWSYIRMLQSPGVTGGFGCGLVWGLLFFTHPWNAVLLGIPFGLHWASQVYHYRASWLPWSRSLLFVLGALPGIVLLLWVFNALTQDSGALVEEVTRHRPNGWLLFQTDTAIPGNDSQTMRRGLSLLWRHVRLMDQWLFGTPRFTLLLWLGLAGHGWNRRWSMLLLGVTLAMFFGYLNWPQLDTTLGGPRFQAPLFPFFILFGAMGIHQIWRKLEGVQSVRMFLFMFLGLWVVLSSVEFLREKHEYVHEQFEAYFQVQAELQAMEQPALVFYRDPFPEQRQKRDLIGANPRGMNTPALRVRAPLDQRGAIRDTFPERMTLFLDDETHQLEIFQENFQDLVRLGSDAHLAPGTGRNTEDGRLADGFEHQAGYLFYGWYPFLPPGRYEIRFDLRWELIRAETPTRLEVMADSGKTKLVATEITGGLTSTTLSFSLPEGQQIEPRVVFGGSGIVQLRRVTLRRLGPIEPTTPLIP